jgi:integrase
MATIEDLWFAEDGSRRPRHGTGKRFRVRWTLPGGVERSRSFPDGQKTRARQFKTTVEADLLKGQYTDPRAGKITLREYVTEEWLPNQQFKPTTRETVERRWRLRIEPVLGDKALSAITPTVVKAWLGRLDASPATVRVLLVLLSSILASAVDDERIVRNPVRAQSVRAPKLEKRKVVPWTAEQVAAVHDALPAQWRAMVDAGAGLGLRISEATALAVEDIDFLRHTVHVRRAVKRVRGRLVFGPPKGGRERDVALPGSVAVALAEHIRQFPPQAVTLPWEATSKPAAVHLLFTTASGQAIEQNAWNATVWHRARKAATPTHGQDTGFHALRHYYASYLVSEGADIVTVSEMLGHHSAAFTLNTYAHLMPSATDRIRAIIDRRETGSSPAREAQTSDDLPLRENV